MTNHPKKKTQPIEKKEEVKQSNDKHIDQDFPGFPHPPAKEQIIKDGSASAFYGTEEVGEDEDKDDLYYK